MGLQKKLAAKFILPAIVLCTVSCARMTPAGFWNTFESDLIVSNESDQGPWGGHREIIWQASDSDTFSIQHVFDFAAENEWDIVDTISFSINDMHKLSAAEDYTLEIIRESVLPDWKRTDVDIFIFRTGWLAVEPGNTRETFVNGFLVMNPPRTKIGVYHVWGE